MILMLILFTDSSALEILITGVIGWALLIILLLMLFVVSICKRSKANGMDTQQYNKCTHSNQIIMHVIHFLLHK